MDKLRQIEKSILVNGGHLKILSLERDYLPEVTIREEEEATLGHALGRGAL